MFDLRIEYDSEYTEVAVRLNVLAEVGDLLGARLPTVSQRQIVVITDQRVGDLYSRILLDSLRNAGFAVLEWRIKPGEASKSLAVVGEGYQFFCEREVSRDACVVALGGGVVSDLSGFLAATWMRGIEFAICPTTLEADVDASIGGKTGINLEGGKNLVGAFHQPCLVAIDPACLQTLDARDVRSGLAESIKHALIFSEELLDWHEDHAEAILALEPDLTRELILRNLRIKAAIVARDALEQTGSRILLNFGHTIGHAIEGSCGFALRHGECVSLGMVAACRLSQALGLLSANLVQRVETLLARLNLPTELSVPIETEQIIAGIGRDKKVRGGAPHFVLLEGVGRPVVRDDIDEAQVRRAYESLFPYPGTIAGKA